MIEELPITDGIHASLTKHFCDSAVTVSAVEIPDWHELIEESLRKWLFQFGDVLKPNDVSALTDERCQGEMVALVMDQFIASLQPVEVWRVGIEPAGFYECAWDDFAIRGSSGFYLLHLGVSD